MRASRFLNGWQLYGDDYWNAIRVGLHQMEKSLTIDIYSSGCRQRFSFFYSFFLGYFSFPFIRGANVIITRTYIIILFPRSFYDFRLPSVYPTFFSLSLSSWMDIIFDDVYIRCWLLLSVKKKPHFISTRLVLTRLLNKDISVQVE